MRVRMRWVAVSRSPRPNQSGSAPYAASSSRTAHVSPARPQPRSVSMPPPRVYMQVSRSGQIRRPCSQMSSPVFTIAVTPCSDGPAPNAGSPSAAFTPSRNRAPPTPPTITTTFMAAILSPQPEEEVVVSEPGQQVETAKPVVEPEGEIGEGLTDRPAPDQHREQDQRGPRLGLGAEALRLDRQVRLDRAPAVQARDRQDVEHEREDLQQAEE